MPAKLVHLVALMVVCMVTAVSGQLSHAQSATENVLYLPFLQRSFLNIEGTWTGAATQPGAIYAYQLSLVTTGQQIHGTATVSDGTSYAVMTIAGTQFGTQYVLDESTIVETNGAPAGRRWCIKTLLLSFDTSDSTLLRGTWKQDGCNTGNIYLQQPTTPGANGNGTWKGVATQGQKAFSYSLSLNQDHTTVQGISTTRSGDTFGTLRVQGFAVGEYLLLQETDILDSSNTSAWCLKTVEVHQTLVSGTLALEGQWSASGCLIPGNISLVKQP